MFSLDLISEVISNLDLPDDYFIRRRVARALWIPRCDIDVENNTVFSQTLGGLMYHINLDSGSPSCTCPDGDRTIYCKHRIALMLANRRNHEANS